MLLLACHVRFHVKHVRVLETVERSGSACFNNIKYSLAESVRSISVVSEVPSSFSSVTQSWCWKETFAPCCRLRTRHFSFSDAVARYV